MTTRAAAKRLPLGQRIRWARERKGISQERFAEIVGTTRRHMIRLEKGQHRPGVQLVERIAEATDQPVSLFDETDDEEADPAVALLNVIKAMVRAEVRMNERGQTFVEYALAIGIVAIGLTVAFVVFR